MKCLLFLALAAAVQASNVGISWNRTSYTPISVEANDTVVFTYDNANHDVYYVPNAANYAACSKDDGAVLLCGVGETPCTVSMSAYAGQIARFICSIGNHCAFGQRIEITVGNVEGVVAPPPMVTFPLSPLLVAHIVFMLAAFTVLMPIGVVIALLRRSYKPVWFKIHKHVQILAVCFSIIGLGLGVALTDSYSGAAGHLNNRHQQLGVAAVALSVWQLINGLVGAAVFEPGTRGEKLWETVHSWSARLVILLGLSTTVIGPLDFALLLEFSNAALPVQVVSWLLVGLASIAIACAIKVRLGHIKEKKMKAKEQAQVTVGDI